MADNFYRVSRGLSLNPRTTVPTNPVNGDLYYDATKGSFVFYDNGFWINLASQVDVAAAATLTSTQFTAAIVQNSLVRITGAIASNLYGLTASTASKEIVIYNASSGIITLFSQDATEPTATNRIATPGNNQVQVGIGSTVTLLYDATQGRWIISSGSTGSNSVAEEVPLTSGTTSVSVTFPSVLPSSAYGLVVQLVNQVDANPQFQTLLVNNKTTSGFTARWNVPLASSNYALDYVVGPGGSASALGETAVVLGAQSAIISFPSIGTTMYAVIAEFENFTDANPQFQPIVVVDKQVNQFTIKWNLGLDSANYRVSWQVIVYT